MKAPWPQSKWRHCSNDAWVVLSYEGLKDVTGQSLFHMHYQSSDMNKTIYCRSYAYEVADVLIYTHLSQTH